MSAPPLPPALLRTLLGRRLAGMLTHWPAARFTNLAYRLRGWTAVPYRAAYYLCVSRMFAGSRHAPQTIRLSSDVAERLSVLLMSETSSDIEVLVSGESPAGDAARAAEAPFDWGRLRRNFSHPAFEHGVNRYLKVAHPGAFVVAVSLGVDEDGFCDRQLEAWDEPLREMARGFGAVALVLLNPIGPECCRSRFVGKRGPIFSAALGGLSLAERVCLAQRADAFIGEFDAYGLAARAAERPGVYMGGFADVSDAPKRIAYRTRPAPEEAAGLFREMLCP